MIYFVAALWLQKKIDILNKSWMIMRKALFFVFANFNNTERFCDAFWIKGIYKSFAVFLSITFYFLKFPLGLPPRPGSVKLLSGEGERIAVVFISLNIELSQPKKITAHYG